MCIIQGIGIFITKSNRMPYLRKFVSVAEIDLIQIGTAIKCVSPDSIHGRVYLDGLETATISEYSLWYHPCMLTQYSLNSTPRKW